jgi:hypothetical protein
VIIKAQILAKLPSHPEDIAKGWDGGVVHRSGFPAAPPIFALESLQRCGADALQTEPAPASSYHEMWSRLLAGAQASADNIQKPGALDFLAKIGSMMLEPDELATPFEPTTATWSRRTLSME